jgi:hypothetical protein
MPVRVTDDVSRGFTAGDPQVVLLRDVIHLFYIEGKYQKGPSTHGMTLLKQPPWDIIYQRRAFPSN